MTCLQYTHMQTNSRDQQRVQRSSLVGADSKAMHVRDTFIGRPACKCIMQMSSAQGSRTRSDYQYNELASTLTSYCFMYMFHFHMTRKLEFTSTQEPYAPHHIVHRKNSIYHHYQYLSGAKKKIVLYKINCTQMYGKNLTFDTIAVIMTERIYMYIYIYVHYCEHLAVPVHW